MARINLPLAVWLLLISVGFGFVAQFKSRPAQSALPPFEWPTDAKAAFPNGEFQLVVAIHPQCPCSRATLRELARLLAQCPRDVKTIILVWRPKSAAANWDETDIVAEAKRLPRCVITPDEEGREAERFGAQTSGQTLLWSGSGKLLFQGGVTASRGHEGDSPGLCALRALIWGESTEYCSTPVFGCSLKTPASGSDF
jgi:hypothetical protein